MSGERVERDPSEYREQLETQVRLLRRSASHYDEGDRSEAQRLAVIVRLLVHDTHNSASLLTHLGVKDSLRYFDTRPTLPPGFPPGTIMLHSGLVQMRMPLGGGDVEYEPHLSTDDPLRSAWTDFADWWRRPVVTDQLGNEFPRADLVLALANQDGGAHIDAKLAAPYAALTRENSLGTEGSTVTGEMQPLGPMLVPASVRQIAFELEFSLRQDLLRS